MFSIHASNQTTYDKIVKYGNFNKVMENIKWLSREKSKRKYKNIELLFVVHALNYKDMPSFVRIAKSTTFTQHSQATAIGVPDILIKMRLFLSLGMKKYNDLCSVLSDKIF